MGDTLRCTRDTRGLDSGDSPAFTDTEVAPVSVPECVPCSILVPAPVSIRVSASASASTAVGGDCDCRAGDWGELFGLALPVSQRLSRPRLAGVESPLIISPRCCCRCRRYCSSSAHAIICRR